MVERVALVVRRELPVVQRSGERRPTTTALPWSSRIRTSPETTRCDDVDVLPQVAVERAEPEPVVGDLRQLVGDAAG